MKQGGAPTGPERPLFVRPSKRDFLIFRPHVGGGRKQNSFWVLFFITFASSCRLLHQSHWRRRPQVGVDNPFRPSASSTENKGWKLRGHAAVWGLFIAPRRRRAVSQCGQRTSIKRPSLAPHSSQWIFFPPPPLPHREPEEIIPLNILYQVSAAFYRPSSPAPQPVPVPLQKYNKRGKKTKKTTLNVWHRTQPATGSNK